MKRLSSLWRSSMDAVKTALHYNRFNAVRNKLWGRNCTGYIRFPGEKSCEDIVMAYQAFVIAAKVCTVETSGYLDINRFFLLHITVLSEYSQFSHSTMSDTVFLSLPSNTSYTFNSIQASLSTNSIQPPVVLSCLRF